MTSTTTVLITAIKFHAVKFSTVYTKDIKLNLQFVYVDLEFFYHDLETHYGSHKETLIFNNKRMLSHW